MTTHKRLAQSAGIIGIGTTASRILGFIRDILIAKLFGTSLFADSFFVAFRIPNLLRDLIGEGAANAAFVPVFSEYLLKKERQDFWRLINALFKLLLFLLVIISLVGVLLSPFIVSLIAPGFRAQQDKFQLTVRLTRIIFPYIFFAGFTAFLMGILHSFKSFASPAFSPAILNLVLIIGAVWWSGQWGVYGLAWAVLLGGLIQILIQVPPLLKTGFQIDLKARFSHPAIKKIGRLLFPRFLGSCVYQINLFVDTLLASLSWIVGEGGVSALYYANRLVQFPLAIFGISVAQAALPTMSTQFQENNLEKLGQTISFSLRSVFFITIPATVGLMVLAQPITATLFQRGEFNRYSTEITSFALGFYALGLFAYSGIKILVAAFYSLQDTFTPVKIASFSLIVNIVLNLILMFPLKVGGLALATSISAVLNFLILFYFLQKRIKDLEARRIFISSLRILLAALAMGLVSKISFLSLPRFMEKEFLQLITVIILSLGCYIIFSFILRVEEIHQIKQWIFKKR